MSNQSLLAKVVDPYVDALISFRVNPTTVLKVLDIIQTDEEYFLNPQIPSKNHILMLLRGNYNPFLVRLCFLLFERDKPELICPILERYIKLCNSIDRIKTMTVTSVLPLNDSQKQVLLLRLSKLAKIKKILLKQVIDSRIYGGFIVETETSVVNASIRVRYKDMLNLAS